MSESAYTFPIMDDINVNYHSVRVLMAKSFPVESALS
jgi:hypothetical protein